MLTRQLRPLVSLGEVGLPLVLFSSLLCPVINIALLHPQLSNRAIHLLLFAL